MSKIIGGLDIKEVVNGGAVFEVTSHPSQEQQAGSEGQTKDDQEDYIDSLKEYAKYECIDLEDDVSGVGEPFEVLGAKMTNLLSNGKIKKRTIKEGYGEKPVDGSTVKINYNAYTEHEAYPFDSTHARKKPFYFTVGNGDVIEGLDVAVQSMKLTEKAEFLISPELAYKDSGLDRIPPNSTVLFEIEMGEIIEANPEEAKDRTEKDFAEIHKHCLALCVKGRNSFRMQDFSGAVKEYDVAANKMENALLSDYGDQEKSDELLLRIHTNLLICHTHMAAPKRGCSHANKIFEMFQGKETQPSAKVYFNNAKCLRMLGDYKLAERRLRMAQKLEPRNPEIAQELMTLQKLKKDIIDRERAFGQALISN